MLADEPFSDRPGSVCPVIAAFLRGYNDHLDDVTRRSLYGLAVAVLGSRGDDPLVGERRAAAVHVFALEIRRTRRLPSPFGARRHPHRDLLLDVEVAGARVGRAVRRGRATTEQVEAFVGGLLASGAAPAHGTSDDDGRSGRRRAHSGAPLAATT